MSAPVFCMLASMKTALWISLALNCGLAGCVFVLLSRPRVEPGAASSDRAGYERVEVESLANPVGFREASGLVARTQPFRWNQVESPDYPTYVANLRAIGCPEQTIRDIITADVHANLGGKRLDLERGRTATVGAGAPGIGTSARELALGRLQEEESSLVERLLGPSVGLPSTPSEPASPRLRAQARDGNRPAVMPLVLREVDLSGLNLDEARLQVINELRQGFVDDVGGPNQDPTDPAYRERWLKAQAESDEMLRGFIGLRAYQAYELEAAPSAPAQGFNR
jgi:hypothetical protein